jgi:hypothetical protein
MAGEEPGMIDNLALALSHGLLLLAAWRLLSRPDLDDPDVPAPPAPEPKKKSFLKAAPDA